MQLIKQCQPSSVVFVHGEASKMKALSKKIYQDSGVCEFFFGVVRVFH